MSGSVNKAILIGHLGADPEMRSTQDGRQIANFNIATSERWTDKATGEKRERTHWHRVVIFNEPLAKIVEQYLKKGSKVYVEGAIETRKWTDQAGVEKYSTEIILKAFNGTLTLLDRAERQAPSEDNYGTTRPAGAGASSSGASPAKPDLNDEIPF